MFSFLQLQRVPQYENFMTELISATPTGHKDRKGIEQTAARLRMVSPLIHSSYSETLKNLAIFSTDRLS